MACKESIGDLNSSTGYKLKTKGTENSNTGVGLSLNLVYRPFSRGGATLLCESALIHSERWGSGIGES